MMNFIRPTDDAVRQRFTRELDKNFSVIAPAGVGKTTSIVDRVIEMAGSPQAKEWFPKLVVVTYTRRAADEMRHRARNQILKSIRQISPSRGVSPSVLNFFNRAFFGTIHSFCIHLLHIYGYHLGLPSKLELIEEDEALWHSFVRESKWEKSFVLDEQTKKCLRHRSMLDILRLARVEQLSMSRFKGGIIPTRSSLVIPSIHFDVLLNFSTSNKKTQASIQYAQEMLRNWKKTFELETGFLPVPRLGKGGKEFMDLWKKTWTPLVQWLNQSSLMIAQAIASKYRVYHLEQGFLTYHDQISLAAELLRHPIAGYQIREEGYRVILDEAQDTDPLQFEVLTELTRPPGANGNWLTEGGHPPRPGHFSMVGDPQQSIYGERANLSHYLKVHESFIRTEFSEALTFEVTFRCDRAVIEKVNAFVPTMLDGKNGQVFFVPLRPRPKILSGEVIRFEIQPKSGLDKNQGQRMTEWMKENLEAKSLAHWLKNQGLEKLQAPYWSEVAILCPRKRWLTSFAKNLRETGIACQIQSMNDIHGDHPAHAWLTALLVIMTQPENGFEIVGVLREIFGVSDQELAHFSKGNGTLFQIKKSVQETGLSIQALNLLVELRKEIVELPLRDAACQLVEKTQLRERLRMLTDFNGQELEDELDRLLMQVADKEAEGFTLPELAETFCEGFHKIRASENVQKDAIQLITCQKAKGLEWHTVILPFMFHKLREASPRYPRITKFSSENNVEIIFDKSELTEEGGEELKQATEHENQRILYVAMTRAKNRLILVDDSSLFKSENMTKQKSFADLLSIAEGENTKVWNALNTTLEEVFLPLAALTTTMAAQAPSPLSSLNIPLAKQHAENFSERILPYTLAKGGMDVELEERKVFRETMDDHDQNRFQYGLWWHEMMQTIPWQQDPEKWTEILSQKISSSPDSQRAEKEWEQFLKSTLFQDLTKPGLIFHTETPFLWKKNSRECIEGLIDLAAYHPTWNDWLIVDWKTDQMTKSDTHILLEKYAPQIRAYMQSLQNLLSKKVRGGIYSTATGCWLAVDGSFSSNLISSTEIY